MIKLRSFQLGVAVAALVVGGVLVTAAAWATCGPEELEVEVQAPETMKVGEATTITIKNKIDEAIALDEDKSTNEAILQRTGSSCKGVLASTASCSKRSVKCVGKGTAEWSVVVTGAGGFDVPVIRFECD